MAGPRPATVARAAAEGRPAPTVRLAPPRGTIVDRTPVPWRVRIEGRRAAASRRRATERAIAATGGAMIAAGVTIAAVLPPSPLAPPVLAAVHALPARVAEVERRATGFAAGLVPARPGANAPWAAPREAPPPWPTAVTWFPPSTHAATRPPMTSPTRRAALIGYPPTATAAPSAAAARPSSIPVATADAVPAEASTPAATGVPAQASTPAATGVPAATPSPAATGVPAATPSPADLAPLHPPRPILAAGKGSGGFGPSPVPATPAGDAATTPDDASDARVDAFPTPTPAARPRHDVAPRADVGLLEAIRSALGIDPERASVAVVHLETGTSARLNDDRVAVPASLYKVGVLAEAYRQIEEGRLRPDEALRLVPADWATGAGILQGRIGGQVTVGDALRLMIGISDNVAAHAIVRRIGVDRVNENNQRLGLDGTRYYPDDRPNTTTAADMARFFTLLMQGKVAGAEATARMIGLMSQAQPVAWLPKGVPGTVAVAHKSGQLDAVRNDAGIVYGPTGPYVVVVLTDNRRNPALGESAIVSVARTVHAYFAAGG